MSMEETRLYTEALISKSIIDGQWETDENGNPMVIIEASNDSLDYQGERVLQEALMDAKDYFLANGVISYDHKHLPSPDNHKWDPKWNPEKYILGKPLSAWGGTGENGRPTVFVKAVLSKSNAIAKEIINKLKDKINTVFASVGGRRAVKEARVDPETYKDVPTIIGVDWDDCALTYKPVNQNLGAVTLSPSGFVKALTAGDSANPDAMGTGGNTLQKQSGEREAIQALFTKLKNKKIQKSEDAINHLLESGMSKTRAKKILSMLIKNYIGDVVMADQEKTADVIDTSTDELVKALQELEESGDVSKAKKMQDGYYRRKNGHMYKRLPSGKYEKMEDDAPDMDDDDDEMEESRKSRPDESIPEEDYTAYDATEDVMELKKSVSELRDTVAIIRTLVESTNTVMEKQSQVIKSLGDVAVKDSEMIKSIAETPLPRQTAVKDLKVYERFEKSQLETLGKVTQGQLSKAMLDNEVPSEQQYGINYIFRKQGIGGVAKKYPHIAEMLVKGKE